MDFRGFTCWRCSERQPGKVGRPLTGRATGASFPLKSAALLAARGAAADLPSH